MANLDLPAEGWLGEIGEDRGTRLSFGSTEDFVGSVKLYSDWYEVVMAVVTEEPFAIGVRYSVVVLGSFGPLLSAFCRANIASFDMGFAVELGGWEGAAGTDWSVEPWLVDLVGEGDLSFGVRGRIIRFGWGDDGWSNCSSCMAVSIALRTREDVGVLSLLVTLDADGVAGKNLDTDDGVAVGAID